jgi:hypothetical protein
MEVGEIGGVAPKGKKLYTLDNESNLSGKPTEPMVSI